MAYNREWPYADLTRFNTDWEIMTVKDVKKLVELLGEWAKTHEKEFEELLSFQKQIINGEFPDSIKRAFYDWCRRNMNALVGEMVHNVFFEISEAGYFVANIPESWRDIVFNTTGLDIELALQPEYGHLVLSY